MPLNGTVAYVTQLPACNFCAMIADMADLNGEPKTQITRAEYDFRTKDGRWAYGCAPHWEMYRMHPQLGVGMGQRLEVRTEGAGV